MNLCLVGLRVNVKEEVSCRSSNSWVKSGRTRKLLAGLPIGRRRAYRPKLGRWLVEFDAHLSQASMVTADKGYVRVPFVPIPRVCKLHLLPKRHLCFQHYE